MSNSLFEPFELGGIRLANRIVMAPMTRCRAINETNMPTEIMETYYEQRASAGLIISEGVIISPMATGYVKVPGLYSSEQVEAWKKITQKVHNKGGKIFAQLWHVGRVSHPDLLGGGLPLAPSAINPDSYAFTKAGFTPTVTPKEMTSQDIGDTIDDFKIAALNAIDAGFDGVELHGANSYLIHQFIATSANRRTDAYGGSVENRARFLLEVLDNVTMAIGEQRVGLRMTPIDTGVSGIIMDEETKKTFNYVFRKLNNYDLAYVHLGTALAPSAEGKPPYENILSAAREYREIYRGNIMINKGFDKAGGNSAISEGTVDLVSYGVPFLANPDLVDRYKNNQPLNTPDTATFYQGGEKGYIDYPTL